MENINQYEEKAVLLEVSQGEQRAFRRLFDSYQQRIYSLAMHLTRSEVLSEEIVQDVFLKVWKHRQQLPKIDYFNSWIRTIARNTITNYLISLARERLALNSIAASTGRYSVSDTENTVMEKEYRKILEDAISKLPPKTKTAYILSRQQGMKNEEIASEMGISVYTVKEHLQRALRSVRQHLESKIDFMVCAAILYYLP